MKTTLRYQVGNNQWMETIEKDPEANDPICTPSDEAFALLNLINLRKYWLKKWAGDELTDKDKPLYTKRMGKTRTAQGWSQEGILKFNELMKRVKDDRTKNPAFDKNLRIEIQAEIEGKRRKKRRRLNDDENITQPEVDDDFDDFINKATAL